VGLGHYLQKVRYLTNLLLIGEEVKKALHVSCKKIEKAVDGSVKAEEILPDYPWEELR